MNKKQKIEEWIKQSEYDFKTAQAMFSTGRYVYIVFMCYLALEKILKALYFKTLNVNPPKTHDLLFLISKIDRKLPDEKMNFLKILNNASIPTRYPEDLAKVL